MPVFIIGSGRCGTSIMALVVAAHPDFGKAPFEPQLISCPNAKAGLFLHETAVANGDTRGLGALRAHLISRFRIERPEGIRGFCQILPKDAYMKAVEAVCARDLSGSPKVFIDEVMGYVLRKRKAIDWIDDSPVNGRFIPFILRLYPEAKFIHMIRDGRDVAKGMIRKGWNGRSFELSMQVWAERTTIMRAIGRHYAGNRYIEVRHDHLTADPRREIDRVFTFLGKDTPRDAYDLISSERANEFKRDHSPEETALMLALAPPLGREFLSNP